MLKPSVSFLGLKTVTGFDGLIRRVKIQNRLIVSFSILTLVPLLITAAYAYKQSTDAIKSKISTYSVEVMNQVSVNIQTELVKIENDSVDIAFSTLVQNTLRSIDTMRESEKKVAEFRMQKAFGPKFAFFPGVTDALVYSNNMEKLIAYGDMNFKLNLKREFLAPLFEQASAKSGAPVWTISGTEDEEIFGNYEVRQVNYGPHGILLVRSIRSLDFGVPIGYLLMRFDERYISKKFNSMDLGSGSKIFVLNGEGIVISSDHPEIAVGKPYPESFLIEELKKNRERETFTFNGTVSDKPHLVAYAYIPAADWYVVSTIPYTYLNNESVGMWRTIAVLGIACALIALYLSYIVSRSISRPLLKLINSMNSLKAGRFITRLEDNSSDELGIVAMHFNTMVNNLRELIEEVKSQEKQKRLAELKALQAQINPHFLSNTLNTVKRTATTCTGTGTALSSARCLPSFRFFFHPLSATGWGRTTSRAAI
ncbi:MAG: hypothetical protein BAA02_03965 [Paenibacillaceae bacterium ZCTH02-B3]|nr:MAG: hypothetical protein BAA02_03965 [Paenibacillaceae bacterium ZCTH02-B3]